MADSRSVLAVVAGIVASGGMAAGCSDSSSGGAPLCVPGAQNSCFCDDSSTSFQVCNAQGTGFDVCHCGVGSDAGGGGGSDAGGLGDAATGDTCTVKDRFASKGCFADTVFWFDDCGGKTELVEACDAPVEACQDAACVVVCPPKAFKRCVEQVAWWFDGCENPQELIASCTGDQICSNGECITVCRHKEYEGCHLNDVWWFDSCDEPQSLSMPCTDEQFCNGTSCVKPFYNGDWLVTADPSTKPLGLLGNATYQPATIELTVDGTAASATYNAFGKTVTMTGTVMGKHLTMTGGYTDPGQTTHQETWNVDFVALDRFEGTINDNLSTFNVPVGNIVWDITGVKQ